MAPMTKDAIIAKLARRSKLSQRQVSTVLDALCTLAAKEIRRGFVLPGIGRLRIGTRKARMGRHPRTGRPIPIPARRVIRFRVSKAFRDAVLGRG